MSKKYLRIPVSVHEHESYESIEAAATNLKGNIWRRYGGLWDEHFAHGFLGNIYGLWLIAILCLSIGQVSTGVQVGYLSVLIPTVIEAFVILVAGGILLFLVNRHDRTEQILLRAKGEIAVNVKHVYQATIARYNSNNDLSVFLKAAVWMIAQFALVIVFATRVTVTPNLRVGEPATVLYYNDGTLENFKNPIKPEENGGLNVYYLLVVVIMVKCIVLLGSMFDRSSVTGLRTRLAKIDKLIDEIRNEAKKDGEETVHGAEKHTLSPQQRAKTAAVAPGNTLIPRD